MKLIEDGVQRIGPPIALNHESLASPTKQLGTDEVLAETMPDAPSASE
jgi:hypothetical protein